MSRTPVIGWRLTNDAGKPFPKPIPPLAGELMYLGAASGSTDISTNSSAYALMAGLSLSITVPLGELWDVLIIPTISLYVGVTTVSQIAMIRANRDSTEYIYLPGGGVYSTVPSYLVGVWHGVLGLAHFQDVVAGAHTFSIEWAANLNGGAIIYNNAAAYPLVYIRRIEALGLVKP